MLIEQPPIALRRLYPGALWRMDPSDHAVYLTFDDGPHPEITPWVLDQLERVGARATFFLVGDNVRKYPDTYRLLLEHGQRVGNHTFHHIKGFSRRYYTSKAYLADTEQAHAIMVSTASAGPAGPADEPLLFRPPHGHMGWGQYNALKQRYQIVMWDVVTRDYSRRITPPQVLDTVKRYVRNGSIITFHDSVKSWENGNLPYALPRALDFLRAEGYAFRVF